MSTTPRSTSIRTLRLEPRNVAAWDGGRASGGTGPDRTGAVGRASSRSFRARRSGVRNTLGTILELAGQCSEAREAYVGADAQSDGDMGARQSVDSTAGPIRQPVGLRQRGNSEAELSGQQDRQTCWQANRTSPSILPHPPAPTTLEEAGLSLDIVIQLAAQDAALHWRADRERAGASARAAVQRHRAGTDADQVAAPGRGRGRRHDRRPVVPVPHHRRGAHAGAAVPRDEPLRRRRARPAGAVPALHGGVQAAARRQPRRASGSARPSRTW